MGSFDYYDYYEQQRTKVSLQWSHSLYSATSVRHSVGGAINDDNDTFRKVTKINCWCNLGIFWSTGVSLAREVVTVSHCLCSALTRGNCDHNQTQDIALTSPNSPLPSCYSAPLV